MFDIIRNLIYIIHQGRYIGMIFYGFGKFFNCKYRSYMDFKKYKYKYIYMENYLYRFYKNIVSWLQYIFVLLNIG